MELKVHRCRFVKWKPSAALSVCFSPFESGKEIAIGRQNGDIELWRCIGPTWWCAQRLYGGKVHASRSLVWSRKGGKRGTLIAAGLGGTVFGWDPETENVLWKQSSGGGGVWQVALYDDEGDEPSSLAVACEDGRVRWYTMGEDQLVYQKVLGVQELRVLSVAWSKDGKILVTGGGDGTVRRWEMPSCRMLQRMTLEDLPGHPALVWSVAVLGDGTIVTGDSHGATQFWDPKTVTLLHGFKQHDADVSCIGVVEQDGIHAVWSGGMDGRVAMFEREQERWIHSFSRRPHDSDCLAMASSPSRLVSVGLDSALRIHSTATFGKTNAMSVIPIPQPAIVGISRSSRLLWAYEEQSVDVWRLPELEAEGKRVKTEDDELVPAKHVLRLQLHSAYNICGLVLSEDGEWMAISTPDRLRLYQLGEEEGRLHVQMVESKGISAAKHMALAPGGRCLAVVTMDNQLVLVGLPGCDVSTPLPRNSLSAMHLLTFSADGQWLAAADVDGTITVHHVDTMMLHVTLPLLGKTVMSMTFHPSSPVLALVIDAVLYMFDVEERQLTPWSREHRIVIPPPEAKKVGGVARLEYVPDSPDVLIAGSSSWLFKINMAEKKKKKKKRGREDGNVLLVKYRPLLFSGFVGQGELVVVERPWHAALSDLPAPVAVNRFGT